MFAKFVSICALTIAVAGCDESAPSPNTKLPPFPADLVACFKKAGVNIPDRDLTIGEVERLWKADRLGGVVKSKCGIRAVAWYSALRSNWK